jgi:hypothetical protein
MSMLAVGFADGAVAVDQAGASSGLLSVDAVKDGQDGNREAERLLARVQNLSLLCCNIRYQH